MSFDLILPFFPEELRALLLDDSISDLMINGTSGVYADRNGVVEYVPLSKPFTNERLQAAVERVARDSRPRFDDSEPDSEYPVTGWFTRRCCRPTGRDQGRDAHHSKVQSLVHHGRADR